MNMLFAPWKGLSGGERLVAARATFTAKPIKSLLLTLAYAASYGLAYVLFILGGHLPLPANQHGIGSVILAALGVWLGSLFVDLILAVPIGWLTRFGLSRSLDGGRPEEPAPLGVPSGVWLSMASTYCMLFVALAVMALLAWQPWWPQAAEWARHGGIMHGVTSASLVVMVLVVAAVYGIPRRSRARYKLMGYVLLPWIGLYTVALVVAIALGLWHQDHRPEQATASGGQSLTQSTDCYGHGPMLIRAQPRRLTGTVLGWAPEQLAASVIQHGQRRVNGKLVPKYRLSRRVILHPTATKAGLKILAVVPAGMNVETGQQVSFETEYADPNKPCQYFPNRIVQSD